MPLDQRRQFGEAMLLHLDAAYNLARWLTRDPHAADDVVQDAYCRCLKYYQGFRGGNGKPWLLRVVRRAAYDWLAKAKPLRQANQFQEEMHTKADLTTAPEYELFRQGDIDAVQEAIKKLPDVFREVVVLRDLESLSYLEVAEVIDVPIGTVMSRLSRARKQLQELLSPQVKQGEVR